MILKRIILVLAFLLMAAPAGDFFAVPLAAQEPVGPQTPPKPPEIVRIPTRPQTPAEQPPIAPDEIIRRFSAQEDQLAHLFATYGYRKTVRLEEIGSDGKVSGQAEISSSSLPISDDARRKTGGEPQSTLRFLNLERDDIEALSKIPAFPLVSSNLPKYEITYEGKQPVDELNTYVFQVKPRQLERSRAYFDGLVWVDDHDLAIVKTYGKWVTETGDAQASQLPFNIFETYRQPVANKYWLPAYSRSDGSFDDKGLSIPVRLIIRWDQYAPLPPDNLPRQSPQDATPPR
ncbi:MAG: hypothetical protein DMG31_01595 [Acidobacteria bacterium]|nr:MAG: hypothetical protein DMG31_01595 [Acidobacteriota bacterium]